MVSMVKILAKLAFSNGYVDTDTKKPDCKSNREYYVTMNAHIKCAFISDVYNYSAGTIETNDLLS